MTVIFNSPTANISANLFLELEKSLKRQIKTKYPHKYHHKLKKENGDNDTILKYFHAISAYHAFRIPEQKHKIYWSREILKNPMLKEHKNRIDKFCLYLQEGSLKVNTKREGYLSKNAWKLFNLSETPDFVYIDQLLFTWGIHHFHLSKDRKRDRLLFAVVGAGKAYLIDIGSHMDVYHERLLKIIDDNWPKIIEPYIGVGIKSDPKGIPPKAVKGMREVGLMVPANVNGKVFVGVDQISMAKTSLGLTFQYDLLARQLFLLQKQMDNIFSPLCQQIIGAKDQILSPFEFEVFDHPKNFDGELYIRERRNNVHIRIPLQQSYSKPKNRDLLIL